MKTTISLVMACSGMLLVSCSAPTTLPATIPASETAPLGINRDFMAVYESREGTRVSTIDVAQSGTGFVMQKRTDGILSVCDNLSGSAQCRTGTGMMIPEETATRMIQVEAASLRRLVHRERALPDAEKPDYQNVPSKLALFKKESFGVAFQPFVQSVPNLFLESCYQNVTTEQREFFCFAGDLMPFWANTTFTPIGNVTLMRALIAYTERSLTQQELQTIRQNIKL